MFVLTNKDIKHIDQNFLSVAWVMPQGWDLERRVVLVGQKLERGDLRWRPIDAHSSSTISLMEKRELVASL